MRAHLPIALTTLLVLAGCSGDAGLSTDGGDASGDLAGEDGAIGLATSDYIVLDIGSGRLTALASAPDLSAAVNRTDRIVFRRVGSDLLIAVFEVTQAQWLALGGFATWSGIDTAVVGASATGDDLPAFALSYDEVSDTLSAYGSSSGVELDLPSNTEWRRACDAGSSDFHWGNSLDRDVVRRYALTHDTNDGSIGPWAVGSAEPNGYGIYDIHGNVCELTAGGGSLRGGAWHQPTYAGRSGNTVDTNARGLVSHSEHALIGARLVLRP